jgi:hypothetical protein
MSVAEVQAPVSGGPSVRRDVKVAAAGGRRRRAGFYSAIRREVPIRTFNDWKDPVPGFCEVDMVAHGGTSVAGSFIQKVAISDLAGSCLWPDDCLRVGSDVLSVPVPLALDAC